MSNIVMHFACAQFGAVMTKFVKIKLNHIINKQVNSMARFVARLQIFDA